MAFADSVSLTLEYISAFMKTGADSQRTHPMIPAFLQCVISLWILLKRIFSFSNAQASTNPGLRREIVSEGMQPSTCNARVNLSGPQTSSKAVFSGLDRTLQESFDEPDRRYGGSVYESACSEFLRTLPLTIRLKNAQQNKESVVCRPTTMPHVKSQYEMMTRFLDQYSSTPRTTVSKVSGFQNE